ncbi:hypothetical protein N7532_011988 [Penicillium argentinense]|uniref:Uncharacterized protein n=1 Tax=Penicillium argentinense TaxID=1131581 RepID=A0A9W9EJL5_9EURO|nr:uncharacterized protein N7532_011988 [Penicillium argentinense]KAJ5082945.1 hypothetical protein N7532_011988 [Penicillium argentinense]
MAPTGWTRNATCRIVGGGLRLPHLMAFCMPEGVALHGIDVRPDRHGGRMLHAGGQAGFRVQKMQSALLCTLRYLSNVSRTCQYLLGTAGYLDGPLPKRKLGRLEPVWAEPNDPHRFISCIPRIHLDVGFVSSVALRSSLVAHIHSIDSLLHLPFSLPPTRGAPP